MISQGLIYAPPDLYLQDCCSGELLIVAHRDAPPSTYKDFYDLCFRPIHRSTSMVGSSMAEVLYCPQDVSLEADHLIIRFRGATRMRGGPVTVDVAIAGDNQRALDVIEAVANHSRFVPPR